MAHTPEIGETVEATITIIGRVLRIEENNVYLRLPNGSEYSVLRSRTTFQNAPDFALSWSQGDVVWHDGAAWTRARQWKTPSRANKLNDRQINLAHEQGTVTILIRNGQPAAGNA